MERVCPPGTLEDAPGRDHRPSPRCSAVSHAGHSRRLLTLSHAAWDRIKATIANIRTGLAHIRATAPQLPKPEQWRALVRSIIENTLTARPQPLRAMESEAKASSPQ